MNNLFIAGHNYCRTGNGQELSALEMIDGPYVIADAFTDATLAAGAAVKTA
jgi:hypothetical protein